MTALSESEGDRLRAELRQQLEQIAAQAERLIKTFEAGELMVLHPEADRVLRACEILCQLHRRTAAHHLATLWKGLRQRVLVWGFDEFIQGQPAEEHARLVELFGPPGEVNDETMRDRRLAISGNAAKLRDVCREMVEIHSDKPERSPDDPRQRFLPLESEDLNETEWQILDVLIDPPTLSDGQPMKTTGEIIAACVATRFGSSFGEFNSNFKTTLAGLAKRGLTKSGGRGRSSPGYAITDPGQKAHSDAKQKWSPE